MADEPTGETDTSARRWPARERVAATALTLVRLAGTVIVSFLLLHILLVVFEANPENGFADFISDVAGSLTLGLEDLFTPDGFKQRTAANYGTAAALWVLITYAASSLVEAAARATR